MRPRKKPNDLRKIIHR